ncbi:hypothetical protein [Candidatus Fukatsuia endosymbiont of Tuberolachnus salignus]|uniref:hypothetical protein n=1 Tax=Candidatus Fukatsuia endosymbiont of Tuberolachnus salignus TaxID=3077957 RepID=UPI00313AD8E2
MDIELEFFRDYKFKGNIYTKCTSDFYTGEIKYILFEHKTAHSDKKGDLEEKIIISEKKENANKLVCFSNLPISVYSVSAFIGEKKLHSAKMDIPSTSISMASINIPTPNLKGGLKLDSKEHNTLSVMFFPDGFNCLQALQEKSPQAVPIYTKWKDKIKFVQSFNPKDIEKKIEFYSQFEQCFNIFDVETDLSDEELLSLAKELESHIFVKYCSLSIDPDYFIPPSEVNDLAFNAENNSITDTPDFSSKQGYLDEGVGMNVRAA